MRDLRESLFLKRYTRYRPNFFFDENMRLYADFLLGGVQGAAGLTSLDTNTLPSYTMLDFARKVEEVELSAMQVLKVCAGTAQSCILELAARAHRRPSRNLAFGEWFAKSSRR